MIEVDVVLVNMDEQTAYCSDGVTRSFHEMYDAEAQDMSAEANHRKAIRLMSKTPTLVTTYDRLRVMQENLRHGLSSELGISPVDYFRARAVAAARSIRSRFVGMAS